MDIFGSALISPSVSWAINRNMASSSSRKRTRESDDEDTTEPDQMDRSGKYSNYQSGGKLFEKSEFEKARMISRRFFRYFSRDTVGRQREVATRKVQGIISPS